MELLLVVQSKCQTGKFPSGKVCQVNLGPLHLDFTPQSNVSWATFSSWSCRCQPDCQLQITLCPNGLQAQWGATEPSMRQKPSLCRIKAMTACKKQVVPLTREGMRYNRSAQQIGACNIHISNISEGTIITIKILNNENINLGMFSLRCKSRFKYKNDKLLFILLRKS